jgi:hypothetical protein
MQNNKTRPWIPRDPESAARESYSDTGAAGIGAVWLIFYLMACGVALIAGSGGEVVQAGLAAIH